jgi:hypothetical protein
MRRRLALIATAVVAMLAVVGCDATSVPTSVQQKDGSVWYEPAPVVPIPVFLGQRCAVLTIDECHDLLHYYGY